MSDPLLGSKLGRFRLTRLIGRGQRAAVYEAVNHEIGSRVAVKVLHAELQFDDLAVERFFREATLVNRIGHDGLVGVQDVGRLGDGRPYLVMELVEGRSLASMSLPLPLREVASIALGLCDVLAAAHEAGVVHRDVRAANVFVDRLGAYESGVKLGGFGLARLFSESRSAPGTPSGAIVGTALASPPEQARGEASKLGPWSDVYSVGILLFQLISGHAPFLGSVADVIEAHLHQRPPPLEGAPPSIAAIVARCLEKDPAARFASAAELGVALAAAFESAGIKGDSALSPITRAPLADPRRTVPPPRAPPTLHLHLARSEEPDHRSRRTELAIGVVVFALVLAPGLWLLTRARTKPVITEIPAAQVDRDTVELHVDTQPSHAKLRVVQGALKIDLMTPATVDVVRGEPTKLLLSSPGRLSTVDTVTPTTATSLTYVLVPLREGVGPGSVRLDGQPADVEF